jgi:hypothetical protein
MLDRLAVALDRKRFLLLLDNFEHLLEAAPFGPLFWRGAPILQPLHGLAQRRQWE